MSEQGDIKQTDKSDEDAIFSASLLGEADANIIYNYYYYGEDVRISSAVESAEAYLEQLPCPYRGFFHFDPNDAEYFFGRDVFVEELFQATRTRNFIAVLGASGSGKSSVVLAGLVPKLQQEGYWKFTHFRPGSDPFCALALALVPLYTAELDETDKINQARKLAHYLQDGTIPLSDVFTAIQEKHSQHRLLLIADQFEELYTLSPDESLRRRFLDCLFASFSTSTSQSSSPVVMVLTMRADFLGSALSYRPFADVLQNYDIKLRTMNRSELLEVIVKPAEKLGVSFETGLVERILNDVENEPGILPLLEFALTELWNKRTGTQLTHEAYEAIGQVNGALANYADNLYQRLTVQEQEQGRKIFIQLVRPGEGTEDMRRLATKNELGSDNWSLVQKLADARLVVTSLNTAGQETVEFVHEALIRNWRLLRQWLDENRELIKFERRIEEAAAEWRSSGKSQDFLLIGARVVEVENYLQNSSGFSSLSGLAMEFIQASKALANPRKLQDYRNLQVLLSKVKSYWVKGVLESSFPDQVLVEYSLEETPDAIDLPWNHSSTPSQQRQVLPPGTRVIELFQNLGAGGTLLILGEKGSGKTTALLQTANDLIELAERDVNHPLPVVFSLTTWSEKQRTLGDWLNTNVFNPKLLSRKPLIEHWLVKELIDKYQVPLKIANSWIDNEKLLLLLDGLDEIQTKERELCIEFLNQFHQQHGSTGIIVCCGIQEYEALATKLRFQQAVCLHPPTQESIPSKNLNEVLARIQIVRGNLLELNVDALVYPTNPMLDFGRVGRKIAERVEAGVFEALKKRSLKLGEAVVTQAGSLPARYLLHAVVNYRNNPATTETVVQGVSAALAKAEVLGDVKTIAFPSMGTGGSELDPFDMAPVVLKAVVDYLEKNSQLERVIFAFIEKRPYQAYANAYQKLGGVIEQEFFQPCNTYKLAINTSLNQLFVGQRSHLQIELQPTTPGEDTIGLPDKTAELYCFISANGLQVFNNLIPLQFNPKTGQPLAVSFELQAYLRGERTYTIQLLIENPDSGKVKIYETHGTIRVVPPESPEPRLPILPTLNIRVARKPDFILQVETELPDGETGSHHLTYYLTSRLSTLPLKQQKVGNAILSSHDLTNIRTLLTQTLQQTTNLQPEDTREQMLSLGTYFFNLLFPANTTTAFHEIFWQAINQLSTWLIIEDGVTWLPWELIVPYHPDNTEPLFFLSEKCQLSRWVEGLGTVRYQEIPLGDLALAQYKISESEQLKQDEDYQAWRKLLNASSSQGIKPVVQPDTPIYGVHLLRYSSELTQKLDIVPHEPTSSASLPEAEEVRQERLNLRLKRPLVALSTINENGTSPDYWLLPERVLPFLRAGASAVISSWWATSEAADRIFWSRFYQVFQQRLTLGEAVWRSRLAVKRRLPHSPDWLAYTLFGDPCAKSYEPEPSEGYTALECLNPDEPLHPGKTYYFRASIRSRPPVWYTDRLIQPEELSQQLRALFMAPGLQDTFPEPIPMQPAGYTMRQATLELTPTTPGNYPLLVQLLEGDELVKTLQLNLEVGEKVDA